jgi:hypothetical protein
MNPGVTQQYLQKGFCRRIPVKHRFDISAQASKQHFPSLRQYMITVTALRAPGMMQKTVPA